MTTRGLVVPLTSQQVVNRWLYLAQELDASHLDEHVLRDGIPERCPDLYYLLHEHNGGKDPTAHDPADRWSKTIGGFVNRTVDCSGGDAWANGHDRYQPERFSYHYDGWINTDSMMDDAQGRVPTHGKPRCFRLLDRPEPGASIVCRSGSPGHKIGHVGGVVSVPLEWDPGELECWIALGVVNVAAYSGAANRRTTGRGWFGAGAVFVRSIMVP